MNKEDYVSLEAAKLLKAKGFNEDCMAFYTEDGLYECHSYINTNALKTPCPTLYKAQKWLRDTMSLHIDICYMYGDYWRYEILTIPFHDLTGLSDRGKGNYRSYEEALSAGILEALKLI